MSTPGNERRIELFKKDWSYSGDSGEYHKTYFLRNKSIAIKIGGQATVRLYGRVNGVRDQIGPDITKDIIIKNDTLYDEMKASVPSWTSGSVEVYILGE